LEDEGIQCNSYGLRHWRFKSRSRRFLDFINKHGEIDVLVNNAGFSAHPTIDKTNPEEWAYDINGNLNGAYNCVYAVLARNET
jgi:NADP-dependent 3-hydroxy acid dehydrogenase YdfG